MKNLPDKIYIHSDNDVMGEVLSQRIDGDIEYIRKDAFIEKACEYFAPHILDNSGGYDRAFVLEGFKKYMKGE